MSRTAVLSTVLTGGKVSMMRAYPAAALGIGLLYLLGLSGCETVGSATAPRFSKQQENMA